MFKKTGFYQPWLMRW